MNNRFALVLLFLLLAIIFASYPAPAPEAQALAPDTFRATATRTPRKTPTRTPRRTPTRTMLPPLPDFDDTLTFTPGGGGSTCLGIAQEPNSMWIVSSRYQVSACFWLRGMNLQKPFQVVIDNPGNRNYQRFTSPNLFIDLNNKLILWGGYEKFFGGSVNIQDDVLIIQDLSFWMPVPLRSKRWQYTIIQKDSEFGKVSQEFTIDTLTQEPSIHTSGARPIYELSPGNPYGPKLHLLLPKKGVQVRVNGSAFPRNQWIFVLVYREEENRIGMKLLKKTAAFSDARGNFQVDIQLPAKHRQTYLIVGVSDPSMPISEGGDRYGLFNYELPHDRFITWREPAGECPGAPLQRMMIDMRGYVCTKEDNVFLRSTPKRSARMIALLPVNTLFTVVEGPVCADNWSWWQISTDDGQAGWIAEGGDAVDPYFICPVR